MKKFLLIFSSVMAILANVQAADEISVQVNNTSWSFKTRLECDVEYLTTKKNFNLILEETTEENSITIKHYKLSKGAIQSIKLELTNYHEDQGLDDMAETLLADLIFTPDTSSLRKITFTIEGNEIKHEAVYS